MLNVEWPHTQVSTVSTGCQTEEALTNDGADGKAGRKQRKKKKPSAFWFWALAALPLGIYLSKVGAELCVFDHRLVTCVRKAERRFSTTKAFYCAGSKTSAQRCEPRVSCSACSLACGSPLTAVGPQAAGAGRRTSEDVLGVIG